MTDRDPNLSRRDTVATGLSAATLALAPGSASASNATSASAQDDVWYAHRSDWDWLVGSWRVHHRRLKARLADNDAWEEFDGSCINQPLLGGRGNVDDTVLELPSGTYHGVAIRAFDVDTRLWSIWWLDARNPVIEPPVHGGFTDGVGTFIGDDVFNGRPIKVRYRWSQITPNAAHWDQAFSPDGGQTWEFNWHMDFVRSRV